MKLRDMAQRPVRNYTLGEVYRHYAHGTPWNDIDDNALGFTRAGRAWERLHTGVGLLGGAAVVTVSLAGPEVASLSAVFAATVSGGLNVAAFKGLGVAMGKVVDHAVRYSGRPNAPMILDGIADDIKEAQARRDKQDTPRP